MKRQIPQHDVRAVANYFISKAQKNHELINSFKPDPMTLQAMVHMAHIAHALCYDAMLCSEDFKNGEVTPYFPTLRAALKFSPNDQLPGLIENGDPMGQFLGLEEGREEVSVANFTRNQINLLDQIWTFCQRQKVDFSLGERLSRKVAAPPNTTPTPITKDYLTSPAKVQEQMEQLHNAFPAA